MQLKIAIRKESITIIRLDTTIVYHFHKTQGVTLAITVYFGLSHSGIRYTYSAAKKLAGRYHATIDDALSVS